MAQHVQIHSTTNRPTRSTSRKFMPQVRRRASARCSVAAGGTWTSCAGARGVFAPSLSARPGAAYSGRGGGTAPRRCASDELCDGTLGKNFVSARPGADAGEAAQAARSAQRRKSVPIRVFVKATAGTCRVVAVLRIEEDGQRLSIPRPADRSQNCQNVTVWSRYSQNILKNILKMRHLPKGAHTVGQYSTSSARTARSTKQDNVYIMYCTVHVTGCTVRTT